MAKHKRSLYDNKAINPKRKKQANVPPMKDVNASLKP